MVGPADVAVLLALGSRAPGFSADHGPIALRQERERTPGNLSHSHRQSATARLAAGRTSDSHLRQATVVEKADSPRDQAIKTSD